MKCYNHHDRDAFGIGKSCGKGLCLECIKEENSVVVCKNSEKCAEILNKCKSGSMLGLALLIAIILLLIFN